MTAETDEVVPDEAEQLDQLQADQTLIDRGVDDVLDEGYIPPDHWSAAQGFGNTAAEMREGESIEKRLTQEEPDVETSDEPWNPTGERREVGAKRAGRLVASNGGYSGGQGDTESVAIDVGRAGGAACAEEAAMHIIDETEDDESIDE